MALICMIAISFTGCSPGLNRFKSPRKKLDISIYSPEGTIDAGGQYLIGVRDELDVFVWRCPELDRTVVVRPEDGKITLPLVGDIKAEDKTPKELAEAISAKLAFYVKEPRVAVGVKAFGDKKVFLLGQVLKQGTYRLEHNDRLIGLITRAGGFTDNAVPSSSFVLRGGYDDPDIIRVNLSRLINKGDLSQNIYLKEGDIVFVPRNEIETLNYVLRKIFPSLFFAEKLAELNQSISSGGLDFKSSFRKRGFWE